MAQETRHNFWHVTQEELSNLLILQQNTSDKTSKTQQIKTTKIRILIKTRTFRSQPLICLYVFFLPLQRNSPTRASPTTFSTFLDHTQWHTTVGRTHLDEESARRTNLYFASHNTNKRHIHAPRQDSNPPSQQAIGRRSSPQRQALSLTPVPHACCLRPD